MRQSNGYIIGFSAALTVVLGGLLALAATSLKKTQQFQIDLDKKKQILRAVMKIQEGSDIAELYNSKIEGVVTNFKGDLLEDEVAEEINVRAEFKKSDYTEKLFPVFKFKSPVFEGKTEAYIIPVYGNGLWDEIWGFVAVENDFNTIRGVVFDHKAETPGLGARITDEEIQNRFKGRKIFNSNWSLEEGGKIKTVNMVKGEGNVFPASDMSSVDGLSGASMTTQGLNKMLANYFTLYESYFATEYLRVSKSSGSKKNTGDIYNFKSTDSFTKHVSLD